MKRCILLFCLFTLPAFSALDEITHTDTTGEWASKINEAFGQVETNQANIAINSNAVVSATAAFIAADTVVSNAVAAGYTAADTVVSNGVTAAFIAADTVVSNGVTAAFIAADTVVSNGVVAGYTAQIGSHTPGDILTVDTNNNLVASGLTYDMLYPSTQITNVTQETIIRAAADTAISNNILLEATARASADTAINSTLSGFDTAAQRPIQYFATADQGAVADFLALYVDPPTSNVTQWLAYPTGTNVTARIGSDAPIVGVNCIRSDGSSSYINTGIAPSIYTDWELHFQWNNATDGVRCGAVNDTANRMYFNRKPTGTEVVLGSGVDFVAIVSSTGDKLTYRINSNGDIYNNGVLAGNTGKTFDLISDYPIYIGANNNGGTAAQFSDVTVFESKIYADVNVIICAGQSNMEGRPEGYGSLPVALQGTQRSMMSQNSGDTYLAVNELISPAATNRWGPEINGCNVILSNDTRIAFIKVARGGTGFDDDWGPGMYWYNQLTNRVQLALDDMRAAGLNPIIRQMWWMQGEEDGRTEALSLQYYNNFTNFYATLFSDLDIDVPIVIGRVADGGTYAPYSDNVRAAQDALGLLPNITTINTDDLNRHDGIHYDSAGQMTLGARFAAEYLKLNADATHPTQWLVFSEGAGATTNYDVSGNMNHVSVSTTTWTNESSIRCWNLDNGFNLDGTNFIPGVEDSIYDAQGNEIVYSGGWPHNGAECSLVLADGTTNTYAQLTTYTNDTDLTRVSIGQNGRLRNVLQLSTNLTGFALNKLNMYLEGIK